MTKRTTRWLLCIVLVLVLAFSFALAACGDNPEQEQPGGTTPGGTTPGGTTTQVTATFVGGDGTTGTAPAAITVNKGSEITFPANTFSKTDFTFDGWSDGTTTYQPGAKLALNENKTFTAQWKFNGTPTPEKVTATFVGGDGATGTAPAAITVNKGSEITFPANTFSKTDFTFDGWSDGTNTYQPGAKLALNENKTFTAQWKSNGTPAPGGDIIEKQYQGKWVNIDPVGVYEDGYIEFSANTVSASIAGRSFEDLPISKTDSEYLSTAFSYTYSYNESEYTTEFGFIQLGEVTLLRTIGKLSGYSKLSLESVYIKEGETLPQSELVEDWDNGTYTTKDNATKFIVKDGVVEFYVSILNHSPYQNYELTIWGVKDNRVYAAFLDKVFQLTFDSTGEDPIITTDDLLGTQTVYTFDPEYLLQFELGDHASVEYLEGVKLRQGQTTNLPNPAAEEGWQFDGWKDSDGTTYQANAEFTMPKHDVTLTAQWKANDTPTPEKVTAKFVGGEGATGTAPEDITVNKGSEITFPANTFSKENFTFDGWSDGTNTYQPEEKLALNDDTTFTAQWKEEQHQGDAKTLEDYQGLWLFNGGKQDDAIEWSPYSYYFQFTIEGTKISIKDSWEEEDRENLDLTVDDSGENLVATFKFETDKSVQVTCTITFTGDDDCTITATWEDSSQDPTTVSKTADFFRFNIEDYYGIWMFDEPHGIGFYNSIDAIRIIYENGFTRIYLHEEGEDFTQRNSAELQIRKENGAVRATWSPMASYDALTLTFTSKEQLDLQIDENTHVVLTRGATYHVTFDLNGAPGTDPSEIEVFPGSTVDSFDQPDAPTWEYHKFLGWFEEGSETAFDWSKPIDRDIKLIAHWEDKSNAKQTVTFNANAGSDEVENMPSAQEVGWGGHATEPTEIPTRAGYEFKWWSDEKTSGASRFNFSYEVIEDDITLYAIWTKQVNITFEVEGDASKVDAMTGGNGKEITLPSYDGKSSATGHDFVGWKLDGDSELYVDTYDVRGEQDLKFVAVFGTTYGPDSTSDTYYSHIVLRDDNYVSIDSYSSWTSYSYTKDGDIYTVNMGWEGTLRFKLNDEDKTFVTSDGIEGSYTDNSEQATLILDGFGKATLEVSDQKTEGSYECNFYVGVIELTFDGKESTLEVVQYYSITLNGLLTVGDQYYAFGEAMITVTLDNLYEGQDEPYSHETPYGEPLDDEDILSYIEMPEGKWFYGWQKDNGEMLGEDEPITAPIHLTAVFHMAALFCDEYGALLSDLSIWDLEDAGTLEVTFPEGDFLSDDTATFIGWIWAADESEEPHVYKPNDKVTINQYTAYQALMEEKVFDIKAVVGVWTANGKTAIISEYGAGELDGEAIGSIIYNNEFALLAKYGDQIIGMTTSDIYYIILSGDSTHITVVWQDYFATDVETVEFTERVDLKDSRSDFVGTWAFSDTDSFTITEDDITCTFCEDGDVLCYAIDEYLVITYVIDWDTYTLVLKLDGEDLIGYYSEYGEEPTEVTLSQQAGGGSNEPSTRTTFTGDLTCSVDFMGFAETVYHFTQIEIDVSKETNTAKITVTIDGDDATNDYELEAELLTNKYNGEGTAKYLYYLNMGIDQFYIAVLEDGTIEILDADCNQLDNNKFVPAV